MSRFSRASLLACGLALAATPLIGTPARADDVALPVVPLVMPVLDLSFGESDLQGETKVESSPKTTTITLDSTVLFGKDSAKINSSARGRLVSVARQLRGKGAGRVSITGYTDNLGSAAHGLTLSRQRARAVAGVLRGDLPGGSFPFTVVGKGEADPVAKNDSEAHRKLNRRVVIVYTRS